MHWREPCVPLGRGMATLAIDLVRFVSSTLPSRTALAAEKLCLRKERARYRERQVTPRRAWNPMRLTPICFARGFPWREALTIVQPATLFRWHREAFHLLWRWRSQPGRPRLPAAVQRLISTMAWDNRTWARSGLPQNASSSSGFASRRARSAATWPVEPVGTGAEPRASGERAS